MGLVTLSVDHTRVALENPCLGNEKSALGQHGWDETWGVCPGGCCGFELLDSLEWTL